MRCVYCGNPSPNISMLSAKSKKIKIPLNKLIDMSFSYDYNVSAPLLVDCGYCGRCYELIANSKENKKFLKIQTEDALNHIPDKRLRHFAILFAKYGIGVDELLNGVYSIVVPYSMYNRMKRGISKKSKKVYFEMHILFNVKNQNYALVTYRNYKNGENIPFTIEKIGGYYE
ncbi:hypothetical protein [Methanothermococcus okinawensis]|uniref:Uncharacterized protein n=1 Tax=Methanothermococcus okinawensis (strain DSM 14208 / JCM 11175 / IH1) TaxID=647113 RepID=F8AKY1_METOI|nr:hypothetical protein [Methanothermococcus okinawensis]AEH06288.1 hypothetical protein Metok_0298 [Methanothermococcus okinawensis IH1]